MDKNIRIDEIVTRLNAASDAYYGGQEEQMTNYEWDALFDELTALEKETGYVRPDSPTQVTSHSGNEMDGEGEKEAHEYPALSLAKTKKVEELQDWAGERDIWLSWKLDGSTLVATYDGGALTRVLTRGNGTVGTNITYMASAIRGIPAKISDKGHLVVRGEATISYADFEAINDTLEDADDRYANPRNLAAGTLALDKTNLDKVKERNVTFNAFTLVHTDEVIRSWGARMDYLDQMGFTTVERERTSAKDLPRRHRALDEKGRLRRDGHSRGRPCHHLRRHGLRATGQRDGSSRHARGPCLQMGGRLRRHGARPHRMVVRGLDHHAGRSL